MSLVELRTLFRLHEVDQAILEIRKRAASLDGGKQLRAEISALEKHRAEAQNALKTIQQELTDSELRRQGVDEKLKKIDRDLYGGTIVNPREVENLQKEIENLKGQRNRLEEREVELLGNLEPAEKQVAKIEKAITLRQKTLAEQHQDVVAEMTRLESEFKRLTGERPVLAKQVAPAMLARYDSIRHNHGGIGMAKVEKGACGMCGMNLATRLIESAKDGRLVSCEACGRLLYATDGLI